jgi:hypothetical protein
MNQLLQLLLKKVSRPPLGRWGLHNAKQTSLKIKYANEDNCGTCTAKVSKIDDDYMTVIMSLGVDSFPDFKSK